MAAIQIRTCLHNPQHCGDSAVTQVSVFSIPHKSGTSLPAAVLMNHGWLGQGATPRWMSSRAKDYPGSIPSPE